MTIQVGSISYRNANIFPKMEFHDSHETVEEMEAAQQAARESDGNGETIEEESASLSREAAVVEKNIDLALECKELGNQHFRNQDYDEAIEAYTRAIDYCPEMDEHKEVLSTLLGNRAACYIAENDYEPTVQDCTRSLELNPNYVKVLLRRSQANEKLDRLEEALQGFVQYPIPFFYRDLTFMFADLKRVQELDPSVPKIAQNM